MHRLLGRPCCWVKRGGAETRVHYAWLGARLNVSVGDVAPTWHFLLKTTNWSDWGRRIEVSTCANPLHTSSSQWRGRTTNFTPIYQRVETPFSCADVKSTNFASFDEFFETFQLAYIHPHNTHASDAWRTKRLRQDETLSKYQIVQRKSNRIKEIVCNYYSDNLYLNFFDRLKQSTHLLYWKFLIS